MKSLLRNALFTLLFFSLINCEEEEVTSQEYPRLRTLAVTDINSGGATFNAEFVYRGNFEILNYGFVWDTSSNPEVESSDRVVIKGDVHSTQFTKEIKSTLAENQKYYVRAFVKTEEYFVYGENIEFISLGSEAPTITDFYPENGTLGDTITIEGKNFSYIDNKAFFEEFEAKIAASTDTLLKVVVPDQINMSANKIFVSVKNNKAQADKTYHINAPQLLEINPDAAKTDDTVKIKGRFIGHILDHIKVNFEKDKINSSIKNEVIANSNNEISVVVPKKLEEKAKIWVTIAGMTDSIEFSYKRPRIISINEANISWGDTLVAETQNFYSDKTKYKIFLNSSQITVLDATDTSFSFIVPQTLKQKENKLFAEIAGFDLELDQSLFLKPLKILNVSADSLAIRDMVSIELDNLHPDINEVYLNNVNVESTLTSDLKNINFNMPLEAEYYKETMKDKKVKISIRANNFLVADTILPFKVPIILSMNVYP